MSSVAALVKNPLTAERDSRHRAVLRTLFPALTDAADDRILALRPYLTTRPARFFDRAAFDHLLAWLKQRDAEDRAGFKSYLDSVETDLNRAFLFLREINAEAWHDDIDDSGGEFDLARFIDRTLHPVYLRLIEGVLVPLVRGVAFFSRLDRGAGTDGLDAFQVTEELEREGHGVLVAPYRHLVRNAIAHGGVTYLQNEIRYRDRQGREETLNNRDIVRTIDDLLDTCNGCAAALKTFLITVRTAGYRIPRESLVEELREETRAPWWSVEGCVESEVMGRSQLLVYARANSRDYDKVHFSAIQTGLLAESLVPGYDRYFFSLRSPSGWPGWVGFDGNRLRVAREGNPSDIAEYAGLGVVENDLVFYVPRRRLSRFGRKADTYRHALAVAWPQAREDFRRRLEIPRLLCRGAQIHRNGWGAVLNGSVVVEDWEDSKGQELVRRFRRRIIRVARKEATLAKGSFPVLRRFPLAFAQVSVYRKDYRARRLKSFGLGNDLVCTVRFQRMSRIRSPDILGSTVESAGRWRVAWNKSWLDSLVR